MVVGLLSVATKNWFWNSRKTQSPALTGDIFNSELRWTRGDPGLAQLQWIQQGMRHSHCSYWLAKHGDIDRLVIQSGHESKEVMWRNYYRATTKATADKFWNIRPPTPATNIVPMARIG